jgi:hypothetical protein
MVSLRTSSNLGPLGPRGACGGRHNGPALDAGLGHDLGQHLRLSTARQQIRASRSNVSKPAKTETRPTECGCIPRINV